MGMFSWYYSDIDYNIVLGDEVFMLLPNNDCFSGCYDGYGRIDDVDIFYIFAVINRKDIIDEKSGIKDYVSDFFHGNYFYETFFNKNISDDYFLKNYKFFQGANLIRVFGIIYNSNDDNKYNIKYPIKLTSKYYKYNEVSPSEFDEEQGFFKHEKH